MPSVDHCVNKPSEMTTLTNSLEIFDTYKHREDKDSDEESFHLPLDEDDSESNVGKNGSSNDNEDDILDKFDLANLSTDPIDAHLEDQLLNEDEDDRKESNELNSDLSEKIETEETDNLENENLKDSSENSNVNRVEINDVEAKPLDGGNVQVEKNFQCDENTEDNHSHSPIEVTTEVSANTNEKVPNCDDGLESGNLEEPDQEQMDLDDNCKNADHDKVNEIVKDSKESSEDDKDPSSVVQEKSGEKCSNSNDSTKNQIEDSEDLFDISIIRDSAEDDAVAYNEAHETEEGDNIGDNISDKNEVDEGTGSDKADNDEEEMEVDKIDSELDQLRTDDVEIDDNNLVDCGKETVSDGESDSNKIDIVCDVENNKVQDTNETASVKQIVRLDERTGNLVETRDNILNKLDSDTGVNNNEAKAIEDCSEKRKSLKRVLSDDIESAITKKSRTEEISKDAQEQKPKPKSKLPLKKLLSLSEFMKTKKSNDKRLTMNDLEEFCLQKICEVLVHKSDLGEVHHQLKVQEQLIDTMRREIQQLTKQARDLEIVNKKLMTDLKTQNTTQKPLNPLKITRSVGLQVKFTPAVENNTKRRSISASVTPQKATGQGRPRPVVPTTPIRQVSPQKPPLAKPTTPLLSLALQNQKAVIKTTPPAPKPKTTPEPKSSPSTASFIDLTDEDDKKVKGSPIVNRIQKNISIPLRTTPIRVNTTEGIRLTTTNGKGTPITSMVNSNTPQLMYVVRSSPNNAVVVNFQPTNGVLPSNLANSVSMLPKSVQSKSLVTKTVNNVNKVVKVLPKHPAPLPPPPVVRIALDKAAKPIPPKPHLTIRKTETGIILQWRMPYELDMYEGIASYQLYAYQETSATPSSDMWRKVGDVKALALPMACTLTQFADKNKYYFAVRPVDIHKRIGVFSDPEEISL